MAIPSKLCGWWLVASAVMVVSCGEKRPDRVDDGHWTTQYSEFRSQRAAAQYDAIFEVLFTDTVFENGILIEAPSLGTAIAILKSEVERSGSQYQLDYSISEPDTSAFAKLIRLDLQRTTLGEAINAVAKEAKATWDFAAGTLTFYPKAR